jgi:hypothetical protein
MDNARGHLAILAGAGLAAALLSAFVAGGREADPAAAKETAVVTLPQRPPEPRPAAKPPIASDRISLARALQGELRRVGCYDGEISGSWDARSRAAMKTFTERVNATLPVDTPDQVLLALVQGHRGDACGPAVQAKPTKAAEPRQIEAAAKAEPSVVPVPMPVPVPVPAVRRPDPPAAAVVPRVQAPPPEPVLAVAPPKDALAAPPAPSKPPRNGELAAGPVPSVGVYERRIKRFVRRAPVTARSLMRSLERAATAW